MPISICCLPDCVLRHVLRSCAETDSSPDYMLVLSFTSTHALPAELCMSHTNLHPVEQQTTAVSPEQGVSLLEALHAYMLCCCLACFSMHTALKLQLLYLNTMHMQHATMHVWPCMQPDLKVMHCNPLQQLHTYTLPHINTYSKDDQPLESENTPAWQLHGLEEGVAWQ